jgi:amino acid adenylation domain-containing protein
VQVESFLELSARQRPDRIALVCGDRRVTYAELEQTANRLAHGLMAEGVGRGDRVAVHLDNSVEAVVAVLAILKAGAVFMMVNPTTKAEKLAYVLNNSRARAIVVPVRKMPALGSCWAETPHLKNLIVTGPATAQTCAPEKACVSFEELIERHVDDTEPPAKRAIDIDLAALIYTSGSTGNPKGVMLTHLNIVAAATSITTYLENTPDDVILNVLPLSFDYGLYQVLMGLKIGGTVVLERSFAYPQAVLQRLIEEKVTGFPLVPTMAAILLQMDLRKYDFPHLRYITNTSAVLPIEHIVRLRRLFPQVKIYSMYGLTECKRVSYLPPDQIDVRPGSVGKGMPNEEVYLVDDQGRRLGPGVVGQLVVRGSNVMKGYWELPEETDRVLRPGPLPGEKVLYTGDLFRTDEEGYLYFVGRRDDIIKSRGEKVSPKEVENVLCAHPEIAEAVVVGVPDEILGQAIQAVVARKNGSQLTAQDVLRHCASRLEDFMVPQSVEFRAVLPKTSNGKIDKRELMSGATR